MKKLKQEDHIPIHINQRMREGILIVTTTIALFLLLSLVSYHQTDAVWANHNPSNAVANIGGRVGALLAGLFLNLFGYIAFFFPFMLAYAAWLYFRALPEKPEFDMRSFTLRALGFVLILGAGSGLTGLQFDEAHSYLLYHAGGILGHFIGFRLASVFNIIGATLILLALICCGVTLFTGLSWISFVDGLGKVSLVVWEKVKQLSQIILHKLQFRWAVQKIDKLSKQESESQALKIEIKKPLEIKKPTTQPTESNAGIRIETLKARLVPSDKAKRDKQIPLFDAITEGALPSLSLLDQPQHQDKKGYSNQQLETMSREVEERLKDFGIDVQVVAVHPGPVITRFEMQLAAGVKVSRISSLAKDLARSLSVVSVRIVEVIPGKSVVGLELPNEDRESVWLSEILSSKQYEQTKSSLVLALGKDISGNPVIVDLAKMPHLLVAGTTGSGKSVGVNAMIIGLLYKSIPEEVRLILVDPKMLELSVYEGIPHLLAPVVTDMKEAANALRWCVAEMERRYRVMAALGVRNITGYNTKIKEAEKKQTPILDPLWRGDDPEARPALTPLPYIVVIIDEYADMMMVVGKKVEQLIARIAQKARAAGIHLILATQRPSVDVVTGLIKANIPSRIAYQVSSKIDSRTVLDQSGADQLLGQGDMLYLPPGTSVPVRIHGAFVSDDEVHRVVNDWKSRGAPEYVDEITASATGGGLEGGSGNAFDEDDSERDEFYDQAVYIVTKTRKASISNIQRRLKIGYNRAARLVEEMENQGVVSPMESNGSREVLAPPPVE